MAEWLMRKGKAMRGNHRLIGREDFPHIDALGEASLAKIRDLTISLAPGKKTWYEVKRDGVFIGYVTTRMDGQSFRTADMDFWCPATNFFHEADPKHGRALLALVDALERKQKNMAA